MLLTAGTPRYEAVWSPGSQVHVIWDFAVGDFCTLPGPTGAQELLTFPHSYYVLKWFMLAQQRGTSLELPAGCSPRPIPEPAY